MFIQTAAKIVFLVAVVILLWAGVRVTSASLGCAFLNDRQVLKKENPCSLCWKEKVAKVLVVASAIITIVRAIVSAIT